MSATTIILLLKTLLPFLKELLLREKCFREFISANQTAVMMAFCLLFVLGIVQYLANYATQADIELEKARMANEQLNSRIAEFTKNLPSSAGAPPSPASGGNGTAPSKSDLGLTAKPSANLKRYTQSRLKEIR